MGKQGWTSKLSRTFSGVRGCWIGFAGLVLTYAGCGIWAEESRKEWEGNAQYILALEDEGKLQEAVSNGRLSPTLAGRIAAFRKEHGPIRWYRIVNSFGYPKGVGHGGVKVIILRGENVYQAEIQSFDDGRIFHWGEQAASQRGSG